MYVHFSKVRWKNFLATGDRFIEVQLDADPTTLIVGSNGAGKSTILDAIIFALFGKPYRDKINKPQLVNEDNGKDCLVEIFFTIGKRNYQVRRGIKPAIFEIYENKKLINEDASTRDYQKHLEKKILRFSKKSFTQIVILGSANYKPFMDLPAAARREVVEDILDIGIFSNMNELLKQQASTIRDRLDGLDSDLELVRTRIQAQEKYLDKIQTNVQEQVDYFEKQIALKRSENDVLEKDVSALGVEVESLSESNRERKKVLKKYKEYSKYDQRFKADLSKAKKSIKFYSNNDDCPDCGQPIDGHFKDDKLTKLEERKENLEQTLETTKKKMGELSKRLEVFEETDDKIQELNSKVQIKRQKIKQNNKSISDMESKIESLTENNQTDFDAENEKLEELKKKRAKMNRTKKKYLESRRILNMALPMLKDDGIKSKIIRQYLPIMNNLINKYLNELGYSIIFNLDETFKETINTRFKQKFTYGSFSEGQKKRIDFAFLFTWIEIGKLKSSVDTNILLLDEIFESSMDSDGVEDFLKLMKSFSENKNVFVISHQTDQMLDKFDKVMKFELHKRYSRLVEND